MSNARNEVAAGPSRQRDADPDRRTRSKPRKKTKIPTSTSPVPPRPKSEGPIPQPYLALAPSPVSALSRSALDELSLPTASNTRLVLPSSYNRSRSTPNVHVIAQSPSPGRNGASGSYAAGLLAPPAIRAGGVTATPRISGQPEQGGTTGNNRRRAADRVGVGGISNVNGNNNRGSSSPGMSGGGQATRRRSEERLRDIRETNISMASLGQLGQILENPPEDGERRSGSATPVPMGGGGAIQHVVLASGNMGPAGGGAGRRRRRIVRGESDGTLARRLTVSSREEGRALGLARGASMRRVNVWDDVPEAADAPPPFPFPTTSTSRLPPIFTPDEIPEESPLLPTSQGNPTMTTIPSSPPPTFDQATGRSPLPIPTDLPPLDSSHETPSPIVGNSRRLTVPELIIPLEIEGEREGDHSNDNTGPSSPTSTAYASAPTSPVLSALSIIDEPSLADLEREDRIAWNQDILAGYTLVERVQREEGRRKTREEKLRMDLSDIGDSSTSPGALKTGDSPAGAMSQTVLLGDNVQAGSSGESAGRAVITSSTEQKTQSPRAEAEIVESAPTLSAVTANSAPAARVARTERQTEGDTAAPCTPERSPVAVATDATPVEAVVPEGAPSSPNKTPLTLTGAQGNIDSTTHGRSPTTLSPAATPTKETPSLGIQKEEVSKEATSSNLLVERTKVEQKTMPEPVVQSTIPVTSAEAIPDSPTPSRPPAIPPTVIPVEDLVGPPRDSPKESSTRQPSPIPVPSATGSDRVITTEGPQRKLTRGKAIRRSSSGLKGISSPTSPNRISPASRRSSGIVAAAAAAAAPASPSKNSAPLFTSSPVLSSPPLGSPPAPTEKDSPKSPHYAEESQTGSPPVQVNMVHRLSAPSISPIQAAPTRVPRRSLAEQGVKLSWPSMSPLTGGNRLRDAPRPEEPASGTISAPPVIPPHREAAMRRRESALMRYGPPQPSISPRQSVTRLEMDNIPKTRNTSVSGPLINLDEEDDTVQEIRAAAGPPSPTDLLRLAMHSDELLQLLDQGDLPEVPPIAESSSQAAARAAIVGKVDQAGQADLANPSVIPIERSLPESERETEQVNKIQEQENNVPSGSETPRSTGTPKKRTPPPIPKPLWAKKASNIPGGAALSPRRSIISTASSPITPRPIHRNQNDQVSPTISTITRDRPPSLPTRRPAPQIPPFISASVPQDQIQPPPLPPRPSLDDTPPAWVPRPRHLRNDSMVSISDTASSISLSENMSSLTNNALPSSQMIIPPWQPLNTRSSPTLGSGGGNTNLTRSISKPRGPRPAPPVPKRPWAKVIFENPSPPLLSPLLSPSSVLEGEETPRRRVAERTHSDNPPIIPSRTLGVEGSSNEGGRPNSMADLRLPIRETVDDGLGDRNVSTSARSPVEYTDLDVLVSRLEGSGREYEGFSQISRFLGPAKSPAATPEALSTLLPGPISVDSRRTTQTGKVKIKLSLLGVRVTKCPICLNQYKDGEVGCLLPICGHSGHEECAKKWFREDDRCFVCRVGLSSDQSNRVRETEGVV